MDQEGRDPIPPPLLKQADNPLYWLNLLNGKPFRQDNIIQGLLHGTTHRCGSPMKERVKRGIGRIPVLTLAAIFFKGCQALQETGKMLGALTLNGR